MEMTTPPVIALYAAIIALIFVGLSVRTVLLRRRYLVAVGHGDEPALARAVRAHGNFAEYVPIAILLIFFVELVLPGPVWVHVLGGLLIVGRLIHAYGVSQVDEKLGFRVLGMALTFTVIGSASLILLAASLL